MMKKNRISILEYVKSRKESMKYIMEKDVSEGSVTKDDFSRGHVLGKFNAFNEIISFIEDNDDEKK